MNKRIRSIAVASFIGMMVPVTSYAMCGVPWGKCKKYYAEVPEQRMYEQQARRNLSGNWTSPDCPAVFTDNSNEIIIVCNNNGFIHTAKLKWDSGTSDTARGVIRRVDRAFSCKVESPFRIVVLNRDKIEVEAEGFRGCGIDTGTITQTWTRN